jgi:caffeoyl-CoA O-methyltransferase
MDKDLFTAIDHYIETLFVPQDEALQATLQSLHDAQMPGISVAPVQGKLLHMLALLCNARKVLEIGTLAGYSAIWMARALPNDGHLITLENDPKHARIAQENIVRAGLSDTVTVRQGQALDLLPQLLDEGAGPFDMVFIDADKPPYLEYFEWSIRLARPGTLIIADNVIREGDILTPDDENPKQAGIQRFNQALAKHPAVTATIAQMVGIKGYDGMALAIVKG